MKDMKDTTKEIDQRTMDEWLGHVLRMERGSRRVTLTDLSPLMGQSHATLSKVERGTARITVARFLNFVIALGRHQREARRILEDALRAYEGGARRPPAA